MLRRNQSKRKNTLKSKLKRRQCETHIHLTQDTRIVFELACWLHYSSKSLRREIHLSLFRRSYGQIMLKITEVNYSEPAESSYFIWICKVWNFWNRFHDKYSENTMQLFFSFLSMYTLKFFPFKLFVNIYSFYANSVCELFYKTNLISDSVENV